MIAAAAVCLFVAHYYIGRQGCQIKNYVVISSVRFN
jgi:hypothetical protein